MKKGGPFGSCGDFTGNPAGGSVRGEAGRLAENAVFQDWVRPWQASYYFRLVFS